MISQAGRITLLRLKEPQLPLQSRKLLIPKLVCSSIRKRNKNLPYAARSIKTGIDSLMHNLVPWLPSKEVESPSQRQEMLPNVVGCSSHRRQRSLVVTESSQQKRRNEMWHSHPYSCNRRMQTLNIPAQGAHLVLQSSERKPMPQLDPALWAHKPRHIHAQNSLLEPPISLVSDHLPQVEESLPLEPLLEPQ